MKAGAHKTLDIMIPREQKYLRFKNLVNIYTTVSKQSLDNLNYNMAMFSKEQDFLRYLRMSLRSPFLQSIYAKLLEPIACNQLIFIPMIDNISLTQEQIKMYEDPDYEVPNTDRLTPKMKKSIRRQNVDFFLDDRSHNERNSI